MDEAKDVKFREYDPPVNCKCDPLVYGWVPSRKHLELMVEGREKELPGYWLYNLQFSKFRLFGKICGWVFSKIYAHLES